MQEYDVLSAEAVAKLHDRFRDRITREVEAAMEQAQLVPVEDDGRAGTVTEKRVDEVKERMQDFMLRMARLRMKDISRNALAELITRAAKAANPEAEIEGRYNKLLRLVEIRESDRSAYNTAEVPARYMEAFAEAAKRRVEDARVEAAFDGKERIYLTMKSNDPLQGKVAAALAQMPAVSAREADGYHITDWSKGRATDAAGKQEFRIGALLRKHAPELLKDFESRTTDNLMVVISRDIDDIARASTNRGWTSCAGAGSMSDFYAFGKTGDGIQQGMMVAYLISSSDPDVNEPLSRIYIKPFVPDVRREAFDSPMGTMLARRVGRLLGMVEPQRGARAYFPDKTYGIANEQFSAVVKAFVDEKLNAGASGHFFIARGVYEDEARHIEMTKGQSKLIPQRW